MSKVFFLSTAFRHLIRWTSDFEISIDESLRPTSDSLSSTFEYHVCTTHQAKDVTRERKKKKKRRIDLKHVILRQIPIAVSCMHFAVSYRADYPLRFFLSLSLSFGALYARINLDYAIRV